MAHEFPIWEHIRVYESIWEYESMRVYCTLNRIILNLMLYIFAEYESMRVFCWVWEYESMRVWEHMRVYCRLNRIISNLMLYIFALSFLFRHEHSASIKDFVRRSVGLLVGWSVCPHNAYFKIASPQESTRLVWYQPCLNNKTPFLLWSLLFVMLYFHTISVILTHYWIN
jgi:hypothetical protein